MREHPHYHFNSESVSQVKLFSERNSYLWSRKDTNRIQENFRDFSEETGPTADKLSEGV
jgi:hypothetical protein